MDSIELSVTCWPEEQPLNATAVALRMKQENLPYYQWSNSPGDIYAVHRHTYHKVIYVVTGSIDFELPRGKRRISLVAGDRLVLPAGTDHGAVVGPEGVVCLEGHSGG